MRSYKAARRAATRETDGAVEAVPFEVTYFDADDVEHTDVFACTGEVSTATITDMAYFHDSGLESAEGASVLRKVFQEGIGDPAEFRRFWAIARYIDDDVLIDVMAGVIEDTTGRPTRRPSDSPAAPSNGGPGSRVDSSPAELSQPLPDGVVELPGGFRVNTQEEPPAEGPQETPLETPGRHMTAVEQEAS